MEAIIGVPVPAPAHARRLRARAEPLAAPLSVGGVGAPLARALTAAGARTGRPLFAASAGAVWAPSCRCAAPGLLATAAGYATGDLSVSAVGMVAYVDGYRVLGFWPPARRGRPARTAARGRVRVPRDREPAPDRRRLDARRRLQARRLRTRPRDGHDGRAARDHGTHRRAAADRGRARVRDRAGSGRRVGLEMRGGDGDRRRHADGRVGPLVHRAVAVAQGITSAGGAPARRRLAACA